MSFIDSIINWIGLLFRKEIEKEFVTKNIVSSQMEMAIERCGNIYQGRPPWLEEDVKTINFAKTICSETARLTTLAIKISFDDGARGEYLNSQFEGMYFKLRHWVEYGNAFGTIILKPNGIGVDAFLPNQFVVTSTDGRGEIDGAVFIDSYEEAKYYYTKLEYHRFEGDVYVISNRAFKSRSDNAKGKEIQLSETRWSNLLPEVHIQKGGKRLDSPLFGVYRTPQANHIDLDSPLGIPLFVEALVELNNLDISYSRNADEIYDSKRISLLDDLLNEKSGINLKDENSRKRNRVELPRFVKNVFGNGGDNRFYQEINPELNTETRTAGINQELDFIGYKIGYSNGYFRFDGNRGMVTATQVEADDRRTIQLIKDHRDKLEDCLDGLIYALNVFADLYNLSPAMEYEVEYKFGDITYSHEEDKLTWWKYRLQGDVPPWMYYQKFEGMTEEDAKKMIEEATPEEPEGIKWREE